MGERLVDKSGEPVYFKEPYFDIAARRVFNSKQEKHDYMRANNIISTGDSDAKIARQRKEYLERSRDERRK